MKRILAIFLAIAFVLTLTGCGDNNSSEISNGNSAEESENITSVETSSEQESNIDESSQTTEDVEITSKIDSSSETAESSEPIESSEPVSTSKPTETSKSAETSKPTETSKSAETSKPNVTSIPTVTSKPNVTSNLTVTSKPGHTHTFSNATCTEPKKCTCGITEGAPLGHKFSDATCTEPKKCSVCKLTQGEANDHIYVNGVCSVCNKTDPEYVSVTSSVWEARWKAEDGTYSSICLDFPNTTISFTKGLSDENSYDGSGDADLLKFTEKDDSITVSASDDEEIVLKRVDNNTLKVIKTNENFLGYKNLVSVNMEFKLNK